MLGDAYHAEDKSSFVGGGRAVWGVAVCSFQIWNERHRLHHPTPRCHRNRQRLVEFELVAVVLMAVALLASYLPARRAT